MSRRSNYLELSGLDYDSLLDRVTKGLEKVGSKSKRDRLELPKPEILWMGRKTIIRNFAEYPRLLRRDPGHVLMFLAKELATAASLEGDRAIFIGRKDPHSSAVLIDRYMKANVICPVCGSPDTTQEKIKRTHFVICEACGARSPTG